MIVGQLWYGWAARGAEGTNQEQIIAGSGNLADRTSALAQFVLQWCYDSRELAFGWVEREGVVVAFRRTPTGLDASGRSGAFFVHALVWRGGLMAPELLAGLPDAEVWMTAPPDDPPAQLEPLRGIESLGLGASGDVDDAALERSLAAHLANVAHGRGSSIDGEDAIAVASRIAAALPARFGLPAFSTHESERTAPEYDILAAPAPEQLFSPVGAGAQSDPLSAKAAQLLLAALHDDPLARRVVDALAEGSTSPAVFADAFRHWAALDGWRPQDPAPGAASLALAASDPRLIGALVERGGAAMLARAIVEGDGARAVMAAAEHSGCATAIVDELCDELLRGSRLTAWATLQRLEQALPRYAPRLAAALAKSWLDDGHLRELGPEDAVALARLLSQSPTTHGVDAAARELLASPAATRALVEDGELPAGWRGRAAAAHPEAVSRGTLVRLVLDEPPFARSLLDGAGDAVVARLADAIAATGSPTALRCAEVAARSLPENVGVRLLWPAIERLPARERHRALERNAPRRADHAGAWAESTIDAYVEDVMARRLTQAALEPLAVQALRVAVTPRGHGWNELADLLSGSRYGRSRTAEIRTAAAKAYRLADPRDSDAALEAVVDAAADSFTANGTTWTDAMSGIMSLSGEADRPFACRLARAAMRHGTRDRTLHALWTIIWVADRLDAQRLDPDIGYEDPVGFLHERLEARDIEFLAARAKVDGLRGATRKWLRANEKAAAKRLKT